MELPSPGELEDASELLVQLAEDDFTDLTMPEVLELFRAFCFHPVVRFARAACDLLELGDRERDV